MIKGGGVQIANISILRNTFVRIYFQYEIRFKHFSMEKYFGLQAYRNLKMNP